MPPRSRPTARILTPAGWFSLLVAALVVGAGAWALMIALPGA